MKRVIAWCVALMLPYAVAQAADLEATLQWARKVELGVPLSGVVSEVNVVVGQRVAAGEVMLKLDDIPFRAALSEAEALLKTRQSLSKEAKRDHAQARELYDRTVLSTVTLEEAEQKAVRAEAAVREARARVQLARYHLDKSQIKAPFDGLVLSRRVQPGQSVVTGLESPTLLVVVAQGDYLARAQVEAARLAKLETGQAVTVRVADQRVPGRVQSIGLEPEAGRSATEVFYPIEVRFSLASPLLRAGQRATVEID